MSWSRKKKTISLSRGSPEYSDDALALEFAEANAAYIRFASGTNSWMSFDGSRWRPDRHTVRETIRRVCRRAATSTDDGAVALRLASASKIAAVETLARSDARLSVPDERWDDNPWLINSPAGIIDLKTGQTTPHDPNLCMTRITAASPEGSAPRWRKFIERVADGDLDLQSYLQRVAGYCLTGSIREHVLFFLLGAGANGKSVFSDVLRSVLGDYATTAASDLLTSTTLSRHPTETASLRGARLVLIPEIERRSRFAESKMKSLTGGDQIASRLMRQDFFTFTPQFKLIITGNQLPALHTVDEASRRRLQIVPFTATIPPIERDPQLTEQLLTERDGILGWAIEGCLAWQTFGLQPPARVQKLANSYLENQDAVGRFIAECCSASPTASVGSSDLFHAWEKWARCQAEPGGSQRAFVQQLQLRGFDADRTATKRVIRGLNLNDRMAGNGASP